MKYKDLSSEHHPKIKLKKKKSDYIARDLATDKNTAKLAWVKINILPGYYSSPFS